MATGGNNESGCCYPHSHLSTSFSTDIAKAYIDADTYIIEDSYDEELDEPIRGGYDIRRSTPKIEATITDPAFIKALIIDRCGYNAFTPDLRKDPGTAFTWQSECNSDSDNIDGYDNLIAA